MKEDFVHSVFIGLFLFGAIRLMTLINGKMNLFDNIMCIVFSFNFLVFSVFLIICVIDSKIKELKDKP